MRRLTDALEVGFRLFIWVKNSRVPGLEVGAEALGGKVP